MRESPPAIAHSPALDPLRPDKLATWISLRCISPDTLTRSAFRIERIALGDLDHHTQVLCPHGRLPIEFDGQREAGVEAMARDRVKVWYDAKGDYLEVLFDQRPGYFRETANEQVMEKVDAEGNVLGFSVLKVSGIGAEPLEVAL